MRTIKLSFVPSDPEDVLEKRAVVPLTGTSFEITVATDARPEPLDLIGKSLERWVPDPDFPRSRPQKFDVEIRTSSNVAEWVTRTLSDTFRDWGTPSTPGAALVLEVEILRFFVVETRTYDAEFNARVALKSRDGAVLWAAVVGDAASRFGLTLKDVNYQEALSDAVFAAYAKLWSDAGFREALSRRTSASGTGFEAAATANAGRAETLTPEAALVKLGELTAAGFDEDALVSWVRKVALTRPLTADDMLAWRKAGVSQAVIRAAME